MIFSLAGNPKEFHTLVWGPNYFHTKNLPCRMDETENQWKYCRFLVNFALNQFITYSCTCYGKVCIDLLQGSDQLISFNSIPIPIQVGFRIFSCDQAALWMVFSVRLSICLSVCPSHLFDYVPIIVSSWNFQELSPRTRVTSKQKVKLRGQRSRSQRSQPNLAVSRL